jgi:hypothetical protein
VSNITSSNWKPRGLVIAGTTTHLDSTDDDQLIASKIIKYITG